MLTRSSGGVRASAEAPAGHSLYLVEGHQLSLREEDQTSDEISQWRRVHDHAGGARTSYFHFSYFLLHDKTSAAVLVVSSFLITAVTFFLVHLPLPVLPSGLPRAGEHSRLQLGVRLRSLRRQRCVKTAAGPGAAPRRPPSFHKVFQVRSPVLALEQVDLQVNWILKVFFSSCCDRLFPSLCILASPARVLKLPTSPR